jgi:hypothetical protein
MVPVSVLILSVFQFTGIDGGAGRSSLLSLCVLPLKYRGVISPSICADAVYVNPVNFLALGLALRSVMGLSNRQAGRAGGKSVWCGIGGTFVVPTA